MSKPRKGQVWTCRSTVWGCVTDFEVLDVDRGQACLLSLGTSGGDTMWWALRNWNAHWTRKN